MKTVFVFLLLASFSAAAMADDDRDRQDRLTNYTLKLIYANDPAFRHVHLVREETPYPPKNPAAFGMVTFRYDGDPSANQRMRSLTRDYNGLKPGEQPRLELTFQRARIEWLDVRTERTTILESAPCASKHS